MAAIDDAGAARTMTELDQRMAERHARLKEKWAADREEEVGEAGTVTAASKIFWGAFEDERRAVADATAALLKAPDESSELNGKTLDVLTRRVLALHALISQHTHALPKYDVKRALSEATETRTVVDQARAKLVPRKKFTFGKRRPKSSVGAVPKQANPDQNSNNDSTPPPAAVAAPAVQEATHIFDGKTGETLIVRAGDLVGTAGSDYFLKDLTDCTVVFMEPLSALKIINLTNCRVFTGPVAGSVFVREVFGSRLHICARQLRIHDSKDVVWFTKTASPPIIEDCTGMAFAGFTVTYPQLLPQMAANGLGDAQLGWFNGVETYKQVKDFKWHRAQASPNWRLLPSREDSSATTATTAVCGGDGGGATEAELAAADEERRWTPPPAAAELQLWNMLLPLPPADGAGDGAAKGDDSNGRSSGGGGGGGGGGGEDNEDEDEDEL